MYEQCILQHGLYYMFYVLYCYVYVCTRLYVSVLVQYMNLNL
jgi:hypothetical protein